MQNSSMQISMKCSIAVHCLIFIYEAKGIAKVTSNLLAESTGSNPVVIRNILSAVKKAGLELLDVNYQGEWVGITARKPLA